MRYCFQAHFKQLNGKAGALVIKVRLERHNGIVMNHKKIRRLMRQFGLVATLRQANPTPTVRWQKLRENI
ncbi:transposase (plasmid) [Bacillus sp. CMF21]|nr:transposase [Bacillus sp. CMF21]